MKIFFRLLALLIAAISSIFTAQWAVRRFHQRGREYYTFDLDGDDLND